MRVFRRVVLLTLLVFGTPASADFPQDLEGELRSLGSAAEGPLVAIGEESLGTFRVDGFAGGDLRLGASRVEFTVPGGSLTALVTAFFPPAYPDVALEKLIGGFDWEANRLETVPGPGGYGLPLNRHTERIAGGELGVIRWNFLVVLMFQAGIPYPVEIFGLEASDVLDVFAGRGGISIQGNALSIVLSLIDRGPGQDCTGGAPGCEMADLVASLTSEPPVGDPFSGGNERWLWEAGSQFNVISATGSLAPYQGWSLWMLGPERDRTGVWKRGAAFLLLPGDGAPLPPDGTPFLRDGLAGAYGVDTRAPRCEGSDGDGVLDECDNCIAASNEAQTDTDGDDIGNACDCDFDQNGFCNLDDFVVFVADFSAGRDAGTGTDMNSDGFVNVDDVPPFLTGFIEGRPGPSAP